MRRESLFFARSATAAAVLALAGLVAPAGAQDWIPHPMVDIELVAPYDPAEAEGPLVEAVREEAFAAESSAASVALIRESGLPVIAQERLLLLLAEDAQQNGTPEDIPALEELAAETPEAKYLAPVCRRNHSHVWFPYARAAREAIFAIRARESREVTAALSLPEQWARVAELITTDAEPAVLYGAVRELFSGEFGNDTNDILGLVNFVAFEQYNAHLDQQDYAALINAAQEASAAEALGLIGMMSNAVISQRARALTFWEQTEDDPGARADVFGMLYEDMASANLPPEIRSLLINLLRPQDASEEVTSWLSETLADEQLGADAADAMLRIAPEQAENIAVGLLNTKDAAPAARRRAVLILMKSGSDFARTSLAEFVAEKSRPNESSLREEVARWLAE